MRNFTMGLCITATLFFSVSRLLATEIPPTILFDEGHDQRLVIDGNGDLDLSGLAAIMRGTGAHVAQTKAPLDDDTLRGVTSLVISGPFKALQPNEIEAIIRFMQNGGRLAVMLHIGVPLDGLLDSLDVDYSTSVLHESRNVIDKDLNFRVIDLSPHPLFSGITGFSAYGAWALKPGISAIDIARTSSEAWIDLNHDGVLSPGEVSGVFAVVVTGTLGKGGFIAFGDDAIFQNRFLDKNNRKLAINLTTWLTNR